MVLNIKAYEMVLFTLNLSNINPRKTVIPIVKKNIAPNLTGSLSFKETLFLSKNPSSLLKVIFDPLETINGTPIIVDHEEINVKVEFSCPITEVINTPEIIPNQNIKFQKLSLVKRDLIKLILLPLSIITRFSITLLKSGYQAIIVGLVIFSISFAGNVVADDNIKQMITQAETKYAIPRGLLLALANVESSVNPYALNISGRAIFANNQKEALSTIKQYLTQGYNNIDIGIMQINYRFHAHYFKSINEMLSPKSNIDYAARLLTKLYRQHGTWHKASRFYHSANSNHHRKYSKKILVAWLNG